ncbi:MAG: class I SAM-dependent methyltransferase [Pseudomonadota bacterium]
MSNQNSDDNGEVFDPIAEQFRKTTELPFRDCVDHHSFMRMAGALDGLSVLDLACGEGQYTRLLKQAGAESVLGVDISHEMIALAEAAERERPLGCAYQVGDVADLALDKQFDVVTAVYLLNYADTRDLLLSFARAIARHMKPGGRFVGLNLNMGLDPSHYGACEKYGLRLSTTPARAEGDAITLHFTNQDGSTVDFDNYYLAPETYETVFAEAGLADFAWVPVSVAERCVKTSPPGYWDAVHTSPASVGIMAKRHG